MPVAAGIAFSTAGATTQIVGSPTPPQKSYVGTITVSTFGMSASRRISYVWKFVSAIRPFSTVTRRRASALKPEGDRSLDLRRDLVGVDRVAAVDAEHHPVHLDLALVVTETSATAAE